MNPLDPNAANKATPSAADSQFLQSSLLKIAQGQGDAASAGPPALSAAPTLTALLHTLKRRWAIALGLATLLGGVAVGAVFVVMPPKYVVNMRVQIGARQAGEDIEFPIFKANMEALMKSPIVLSAALNEKTSDGREIKDLDLVRGKGMAVIEWLEASLKTDFLLGPEILRVSLPADQPEEAAELLNAMAKVFINEYAQIERSKKDQRLREIRAKKDGIESELRTLRSVLETQTKSLNVKDREAAEMHRTQLSIKWQAAETARRSFAEQIATAESDIIANKAAIESLPNRKVPQGIFTEVYSKDPGFAAQYDRLTKIEAQIADAYSKFNEPYSSDIAVPLKHEKIKILDRLVPAVELRWRASEQEHLENQNALAAEKIKTFTRWRDERAKEIQTLERQVKEMGSANQNKPAPVLAIEDQIDQARSALTFADQKIREQDLEAPAQRVRVVQPASPPTSRDSRTQTKLAGAGGLSLFIMALFGVAFFEFRARRLVIADDVTHGLGLNVIGTIPAMPTRSRKTPDTAAQEQWLHQLQESVDAIRTVLLHHARSESLHVILVTSANSGEGKTTLTTQLAASLARAWKRTLVIDGDLRHPATHKLFDVPQEPGLAEVLRGEVEPGDAIRATPYSRLWVLPAGNGDNHAIQALAQDNVRTLFEQLKTQYDFILIDSPPVLPVTDALLLGQNVDGVVLSVLRDISRAPAIHAAQQKLAPLGVPVLGAVVLGAEPEFNDRNYRYALTQGAK